MNIDVRTSAGLPTVYVDIIRGGQIMLSRWYEVKNGQATQRIDLPQNVFGSLEVHAYQMLAHGEIIRDSRVAYVQSRDDLKIDIQADKSEYTPGSNGRLHFAVTDSKGNPTAAALGVIIVDEAVYALQELQPGLEKVYFSLQEELLKPQVQLKMSPGDRIDNLIMLPVIPAPRQQIAQVLLTGVKLPVPARWAIDPAIQRRQQVQGQVQQIGSALFQFVFSRNDNFLVYDKEAKKWNFRPALLDDLAKAGFIHPQGIESPFGGKLTAQDMMRLEKNFTPDALGQAITAQRISRLAAGLTMFANSHKDRFLKNGTLGTSPDRV